MITFVNGLYGRNILVLKDNNQVANLWKRIKDNKWQLEPSDSCLSSDELLMIVNKLNDLNGDGND